MELALTTILPILLLISEALSLIPRLKSNGIFQLIFNAIRWLASKPRQTPENGG